MLGANSSTSWFNTPKPYDLDIPSRPTVKVFVSYSHIDKDIADKLCSRLNAEGLSVVVDSGALAPGRSIEEFIREGVRLTDATISIVSKHSLISAWVALESEEALRHQRKKFFGCYVDDSFLQHEFIDDALDNAAAQGREVGQRIKRRIDADHGFDDLYADWNRYRILRSSIDNVIARLRETKCLSLQSDAFENSVQILAQTLKALRT